MPNSLLLSCLKVFENHEQDNLTIKIQMKKTKYYETQTLMIILEKIGISEFKNPKFYEL